jgi:glutamate 5-kinase
MTEAVEQPTVVVKIGSAVLLRDGVHPDRPAFCALVEELAGLVRNGRKVVVVTSGAVATGRQKLNLPHLPAGERNIPVLQALAALGQSRLIQHYESEFALYGLHVAQILLTRDDFNDRRRYINARHALKAVQDFGAVPIINENDTVATDEIRFGDNDQLAAMVAAMIGAERLLLLSDVDALYTADPNQNPDAQRIREHLAFAQELDAMVGGSNADAGVGTGGMKTKLLASRIAATVAIPTVIAAGKQPGIIGRILAGDDVGTTLLPDPTVDRLAARKAWIGTGVQPKGRLVCDAGAVKAIVLRGKSLLPSGILDVEGDFREGDAVELVDTRGDRFAQGLASYAAEAVRTIQGRHSADIATLLGYRVFDAVVHRDEMVLNLQFEAEQ